MMVSFTKFAFICALSVFLQEIWLNSQSLFDAFDTVINSLPQAMVAGKTAEFIIQRGIDMIEYLTHYLVVLNQSIAEDRIQGKVKDRSAEIGG